MATAAFVDCGNRAVMRNGEDVLCQNRSFGMLGGMSTTRKRKTMAPVMVASTPSKTTANASGGMLTTVNGWDDRRRKLPLISPEILDEWMTESVVEIMKNIKQAPFLIHVFSNEEKKSKPSSSSLRLQTEPVRTWDSIKNRWTEDGCSVPDGIILVKELRGSEEEEEEEKKKFLYTDDNKTDHSHSHSHSHSQPQSRSSNTRTWGLLVQGRGAVDCSACYILNTCRVLSSVGASTHFNLIRASCYGETAETQLRNSWLQQ